MFIQNSFEIDALFTKIIINKEQNINLLQNSSLSIQ